MGISFEDLNASKSQIIRNNLDGDLNKERKEKKKKK